MTEEPLKDVANAGFVGETHEGGRMHSKQRNNPPEKVGNLEAKLLLQKVGKVRENTAKVKKSPNTRDESAFGTSQSGTEDSNAQSRIVGIITINAQRERNSQS